MAKTFEILLPEILDISAFEALKAQLQKAESQKSAVQLNASKVERLTTPCMQLILAFMRGEGKKTKRNIIHPSHAMATAWADFGLHHLFPLEHS